MAYKIVFKAVAVILALCVIPLAIFSPMIQIVGDISISKSLVGEDISLYDIYKLFFSRSAMFDGFGDNKLSEPVRETMPELITSGAFLAVILLLGIATACVAVFQKKKLPVLILFGVSALCVIGLFVSFKAFAAPYLDGTIGITELGFMEEGILESLFSSMIHLSTLRISSAGFLMFGASLSGLLWTLAFIIVEIGETEKPKKIKS